MKEGRTGIQRRMLDFSQFRLIRKPFPHTSTLRPPHSPNQLRHLRLEHPADRPRFSELFELLRSVDDKGIWRSRGLTDLRRGDFDGLGGEGELEEGGGGGGRGRREGIRISEKCNRWSRKSFRRCGLSYWTDGDVED